MKAADLAGKQIETFLFAELLAFEKSSETQQIPEGFVAGYVANAQ